MTRIVIAKSPSLTIYFTNYRARGGVLSAIADRAHLRDKGLILGSLPDVRRGRFAVVQVFQESTPDFVSACAVLNQGVCHEVLNLPHEAGDEHTSDLIGTEMSHFTVV